MLLGRRHPRRGFVGQGNLRHQSRVGKAGIVALLPPEPSTESSLYFLVICSFYFLEPRSELPCGAALPPAADRGGRRSAEDVGLERVGTGSPARGRGYGQPVCSRIRAAGVLTPRAQRIVGESENR
jgi:hypothetical protein